MSEVAHARSLVRCAIRPLWLSPNAKARRTDDQPAIAITRLGMVSKPLTTVERMRGEPTPSLAERPSWGRKRTARARARESARLQRGGNGAKPEVADGNEAEGRKLGGGREQGRVA